MAIVLWLKIDDLKKMNHQQGETSIKFAERFRYVRRMNKLAQAVSAGGNAGEAALLRKCNIATHSGVPMP
jgi:hypothetical protein